MKWNAYAMEQDEGGRRRAHLLITAEEDEQRERTPLLLNLVLDRSGSMTGAPLAAAVDAAQQILEQCGPDDYVGLIVFDGRVEQRVPVLPMTDTGRRQMVEALRDIVPGRGTALHQAVRAAASGLSRLMMPGRVGRLILLTDGEPSVGPKSEAQFAALGQDVADAGVSLMPVGLGSHYVPEILAALARPSGNPFGHADGPDGLGMVMGGVFALLMGETSHGVSLRVTPRELRLLELRHKYPSSHENGSLLVRLGGLLPGQARRVLFAADPASPAWTADVTGVSVEQGEQRSGSIPVARVWPESAEGRLVRSVGLELDLLDAEMQAWARYLEDDGRAMASLEAAEACLRELVALDVAAIDKRRHLERIGDLRLAIEHGVGDAELLSRRTQSEREQTHVSRVIAVDFSRAGRNEG